MARNKCFNNINKMCEDNETKMQKLVDSAILSFCSSISGIVGMDTQQLYGFWKNGVGSYDSENKASSSQDNGVPNGVRAESSNGVGDKIPNEVRDKEEEKDDLYSVLE